MNSKILNILFFEAVDYDRAMSWKVTETDNIGIGPGKTISRKVDVDHTGTLKKGKRPLCSIYNLISALKR